MKVLQRTVYRCDHCGKNYFRKDAAVRHEKICTKNPDNFRACFGCAHLTKKTADVYTGIDNYWNGEPVTTPREVLFCPVFQTYLYPPKHEIFGSAYEIPDEVNRPMPRHCADQVPMSRFPDEPFI